MHQFVPPENVPIVKHFVVTLGAPLTIPSDSLSESMHPVGSRGTTISLCRPPNILTTFNITQPQSKNHNTCYARCIKHCVHTVNQSPQNDNPIPSSLPHRFCASFLCVLDLSRSEHVYPSQSSQTLFGTGILVIVVERSCTAMWNGQDQNCGWTLKDKYFSLGVTGGGRSLEKTTAKCCWQVHMYMMLN